MGGGPPKGPPLPARPPRISQARAAVLRDLEAVADRELIKEELGNPAIVDDSVGSDVRAWPGTRGGTPQTPQTPQMISRALDLGPASERAALLSVGYLDRLDTTIESIDSSTSFLGLDAQNTAHSAGKFSTFKKAAGKSAAGILRSGRRRREEAESDDGSGVFGLMAGSPSAFTNISPVATVTPQSPKPNKPAWRG